MSSNSVCNSSQADLAEKRSRGQTETATGSFFSRFETLAPKACTLTAFLVPLKLSLTYIVLIPLIVGHITINRRRITGFFRAPTAASVTAPLVVLFGLALLSSIAGLSISHSLPSLASLIFFAATIPIFASYGRARTVCSALIAGQTIAALHSFFESATPGGLARLFLGKVTESGQLALTIPMAIGFCLMNWQSAEREQSRWTSPTLTSICSAILTLSLLAIGFHNDAALSSTTIVALGGVVTMCMAMTAFQIQNSTTPALRSAIVLTSIALPLLICALVVNLKRGPWIGTLVAVLVFCLLHARRLALFVVASAIVLATSITPVRERLLDSYKHFTISGGRSTIWRIGAELATEYPLGIGYHNSGILRQFAPEIPPELKHFHNNFINITTEVGWFGGAVFLWFLIVAIRACFKDPRSLLYTSIGCALISWQIAGLVEYNFGDSEITIIVWTLLGLVLSNLHNNRAPT